MGLLFSKVKLSADNGSTEELLCSGIPTCESDLEDWKLYSNFLEDNTDAEFIDVEVDSYIYGEGETVNANCYEIADYTRRGDRFFNNPNVHKQDSSKFIILLDQEQNNEMEMK